MAIKLTRARIPVSGMVVIQFKAIIPGNIAGTVIPAKDFFFSKSLFKKGYGGDDLNPLFSEALLGRSNESAVLSETDIKVICQHKT